MIEKDLLHCYFTRLREQIGRRSPYLLPYYDLYAAEAVFGRQLVESHLLRLAAGSKVLEVGAGCLLLASLLQLEGFEVTAVEPVGCGFGHLQQLQQAVLEVARNMECAPRLEAVSAEDIDFRDEFAFAFSVNAMEHVAEVGTVLRRVYAALKPGGCYHFICPNYSFPYEPHFNMPTFGSKDLTGRLMARRISGCRQLPDPQGAWQSLNWITVSKVSELCRRELKTVPEFDKTLLLRFVQRACHERQFAKRRGFVWRLVIKTVARLGLARLWTLAPASWQPAMACTVRRA